MAELTPTPGAQVANGTYTLTNPLTGANGTAVTAPRSDMRPMVPSPATPTTQASGDAATSGAGTGFATDTHKHGFPTLSGALAIPEYINPRVPIGSAPIAARAAVANQAILVPMEVITANLTLANFIINIGTQNGNYDVGVYSTTDDATFTRVASLGTTAVPAAATRVALGAINAALVAGTRYFYAIAFNGAVAAFGSFDAVTTGTPVLNTIGYTKVTSFPLPSSLTSVTAFSANSAPTPGAPLMFGVVTGGMAI